MKADVVVYANDLQGALKRFSHVTKEVQRDAKKKKFFVRPGELRRIMKKRGIEKWRKKEARIERRLQGYGVV